MSVNIMHSNIPFISFGIVLSAACIILLVARCSRLINVRCLLAIHCRSLLCRWLKLVKVPLMSQPTAHTSRAIRPPSLLSIWLDTLGRRLVMMMTCAKSCLSELRCVLILTCRSLRRSRTLRTLPD